MDFLKIQKQIGEFCEARDWDQFHDPKSLACMIVTESSELLEIFRFMKEGEASEALASAKVRGEVESELADILFGLARFCQLHGIDLEKAFTEKMKSNSERYSVEKARGRAEKYTEL